MNKSASAERIRSGIYSSIHEDGCGYSVTYKRTHPSWLQRGRKQYVWSYDVGIFDENATNFFGRANTLNEARRMAYMYLNFHFNRDEIWELYAKHGMA